MKLLKCSLRGFKSFADATALEFGEGISAVVGPNGSGKSNVLDAIKWVLGEQSAKSLRGSKMDDFIFAGSSTRAPLGMAEVSLTIDNSDHQLPIDYSEVVISRRVFRSGQSEYKINGQVCRLKDIVNLFLNTGLGKNAYAFIGQGQIDEILNSKPEDLRLMFEEAAGISRYKERKHESMLQLKKTQGSLTRVSDIVSELNNGLPELEERAMVAKRYQELNQKKSYLEKQLLASQYNHLKDDLKNANVVLESVNYKTEEIALVMEKHQSDRQGLLLKEEQVEERVREAETQSVKIEAELEQQQKQRQLLVDRIDEHEQNKQRVEKELLECNQRLSSIKQRVENKETEKGQAEKAFATIERELDRVQEELMRLEGSIGAQNSDSLADEGQQLEIDLHLMADKVEDIKARSDQLLEEKADLDQARNQTNELCCKYEARLQNLQRQLAEVLQAHKDLAKEKDVKHNKLQLVRDTLKEETSQLRSAEQAFNKYTSQYQALQKLVSSYAGFSSGVKQVLTASTNGRLEKEGILGVLAELINVPTDIQEAITSALGGSLQYVITRDTSVAKQAINYLKKHRGGKTTFLPLDRANPRTYRLPEFLRHENGVMGQATELIQYHQEVEPVIQQLLGSTVIVEDMDAAIRITRKKKLPFRFVTKEGEVFSSSGTISGGRSNGYYKDLLGRKQQLKKLSSQISKAEQVVADRKLSISSLRENEQDLEAIISKQAQQEQNLIEKQRHAQTQIMICQRDLEEQTKKRQQLIDAITSKNEKHDTLQRQLVIVQEELTKKREKLDNLNQQLLNWRSEEDARNSVQEEFYRLRVEFTRLEERKTFLNSEFESLRMAYSEVQQKQGQLNERLDEAEMKLQKANQNLTTLQGVLKEMRSNRVQASERVVQIRNELQEIRLELKDVDTKLHLAEREGKKLQDSKQETSIKIAQLQVALRQKEADLYQKAGVKDPQAMDITILSKTKAKGTADNIARIGQEIDELGDVDQGALSEFERRKNRIDFLSSQQEDLLQARDKMLNIIKEIDSTCSKRLLETVAKINISFGEVYSQLFRGGYAELKLTDERNLLESGIVINAKAPGKKLQQLSLFSGGEKALTAIALLFAIFKVKPAPFCVLDEIDAALDETNNIRLARYLQEVAEHTQVIVITHSKHTMVAATQLYGVTMEDKGVSRTVSIQMEQAQKDII